MQCHEHWMHRSLRRVITLLQHCTPRIQKTSRDETISNLIRQVIRHSAVRIDALKVRSHLTRQKERRDMEVLVMRGCKLAAPGLRLPQRWPFQRSQVFRRSTQKCVLGDNPVAHRGTPPGKTAVLISRDPPLRLIIRANRSGTSSSPARPVMYSAHLNRPLVTRPNAVRQLAGVW